MGVIYPTWVVGIGHTALCATSRTKVQNRTSASAMKSEHRHCDFQAYRRFKLNNFWGHMVSHQARYGAKKKGPARLSSSSGCPSDLLCVGQQEKNSEGARQSSRPSANANERIILQQELVTILLRNGKVAQGFREQISLLLNILARRQWRPFWRQLSRKWYLGWDCMDELDTKNPSHPI
jgi:hypothetical protein